MKKFIFNKLDAQTFSSSFQYSSAKDAYHVIKTTKVLFETQPFVYLVDVISEDETSRVIDFAEKVPSLFNTHYDTGKIRSVQQFDDETLTITSVVPLPGGMGKIVAYMKFEELQADQNETTTRSSSVDSVAIEKNLLHTGEENTEKATKASKMVQCVESVEGEAFMLTSRFIASSIKDAHSSLVKNLAKFFEEDFMKSP